MTEVKILSAVQHIRRMRGGSQAHLMRTSDNKFYVVKFQNNPQHKRVLANEYLGSRIAEFLGIPTSPPAIVNVSEWLIANTPDLTINIAGVSTPCMPGQQLGLRYATDIERGFVFDYLPESLFESKVSNPLDFARALVFDKWTGNADGRQTIFSKCPCEKQYRAVFIDQGYCFNAGQWNFPDLSLHGVYYRNHVYQHVTGWHDFQPALRLAEQIKLCELWKFTDQMPFEWWQEHEQDCSIEGLINELYARRSLIRDLITAFRHSPRNPFPNWKEAPCPVTKYGCAAPV